MGTSLSGLTPATTFDGLLKVGDNDPLTSTLKAISTGDGTDTMLELSTTALQIGGATGMYWDNTNKRLGINNTSPSAPLEVNGEIRSTSLIRLMIGGSNKVLMQNANTIINSNVAIGQATAPTARLHIKGSGTTSATTSLLVQNSAGTDMLKVQDDSSLLMYRASNGVELLKIGESGGNAILYANGNTNRSLVLGYENTLTAFNQSVFKTYNGTGYSEAMVITGNSNTSQFVGIGETTPTARLQVKGSGNDATTTALLVQNSDGAELLKVLDTGDITIDDRLGIGIDYVRDLNRIQTAALSIGSNTFYAASGTQVHIKGSGITSATTALLVQNSAGTDHLSVRDDGVTTITSSAQSVPLYINASGNATAGIEIRSTGARRFRILSTSTITTLEATNTGGISTNASLNVGSGYTPANASAVLQADSTTQGFLPPRMTTTERDAISTPAAGLMVYNTDTNTAECWNGSVWMPMF